MEKNKLSKNIRLDSNDEFAQMDKNSVSSKDQLKGCGHVFFENDTGKGKRFLFVGNSITLHGIKEDLGWHGHWGMAASDRSKDYVHLIMEEIKKTDPDAAFCICQVADWERNYKDGSSTHRLYERARDFGADLIIFRSLENAPKEEFEKEIFKKSMGELLTFLGNGKNPDIVLTTAFWKHPGDNAIIEYAKENSLPLKYLGDLGEKDDTKAIGLFEHDGVANHPGDLGMKLIAERILEMI